MTDGPASPGAEATEPERDFGSENYGSKILSGGIVRVLGFAISTLAAVASTSILARTIGPADFAAFTTAFSLIAIGFSFSDFGLLALGVREYSLLSGAERERSLRALITVRMLFSVLAAIGIVAFAALSGLPGDQVAGLAAAGLGLVAFSLYVSYNVPIQATLRLNLLAVLDTTRQALHSSLIVIAALLSASVGVIVGMFLPASVIMMLTSLFIARRYGSVLPSLDFAKMRSLLKDVGAFAVAASVGTIYIYLAQIVSNHVLTEYESGQFALSFRVYAVAIGACLTAVTGAFPLLVTAAEADRDRMHFAARRLFQTVTLAGLASTVGLVTGAAFVVAVLGGSEFEDAIEPIRIISIGLPFSFVLVTGTQVLLAAGRHREFVVISIVGAIVSVAATWALASSLGTDGAAIGLALGEVLLALGYLLAIARTDRAMLPDLKWLLGAVICALAGCALALTPLPGLVCALAGLLAMGVLAVLLKLVPPEILALIPGRS